MSCAEAPEETLYTQLDLDMLTDIVILTDIQLEDHPMPMLNLSSLKVGQDLQDGCYYQFNEIISNTGLI